jgi:hypothetical protein
MATQECKGWEPNVKCVRASIPLLTMGLLPSVGGVVVFGVALFGLPFNAHHLSQFEALNRELGRLCSQPPPQAHNVCRLHARLLSSL